MKDAGLLKRQVSAAIRSFPQKVLSEKEFDRLALCTWRRQRALNLPYARFAAARGAGEPKRWRDIPAMPVSGFKAARIFCFGARSAKRVFRTSGTTRGTAGGRGTHYFRSLDYYDDAIRSFFRHCLMKDAGRLAFASLVPPAAERRDSSLSYMAARVHAMFGAGAPFQAARGGRARFAELAGFLAQKTRRKKPVLLFSTTLALGAFLKYLEEKRIRIRLMPGSRVLETGGAKGRKDAVSREEVVRLAAVHLGIPAAFVVNEYGMTELSSQFYDANLTGRRPRATAYKAAPPWTRVAVLDPVTGRLKMAGKGLLRIWDLANQDSCAVVQTEDLAEVRGHGFRLLGRLAGADLRGCSLTFEELERLA